MSKRTRPTDSMTGSRAWIHPTRSPVAMTLLKLPTWMTPCPSATAYSDGGGGSWKYNSV